MKLQVLLSGLILSLAIVSCGDSPKEEKKPAAEKKDEITVEKYCNVYKEIDSLMMEKYWPEIKGKSYSEAKDIYAEYNKEENEIYEKYNIDDPLDLGNFFRGNFRAIREYRENDPEYKKYPEYEEARQLLASYAMAAASEK